MSTQLSRAVVRIRGMILRGELTPGQRVAEAPLAELLGVSRTPVRQALPLLAQEGLLTEHETRGFVVRAFTSADIVDAIDLRGVLEGLVVRRVAEKGVSRAALRELKSCLEDGDAILSKRALEESDEARYAEMNARLHAILLREADSAILADALDFPIPLRRLDERLHLLELFHGPTLAFKDFAMQLIGQLFQTALRRRGDGTRSSSGAAAA